MIFFGYGCCRYQGMFENPGILHKDKTIEECKSMCMEDMSCIASEINNPSNDKYDCITYHGDGKNFYTGCNRKLESNQCYRKKGNYL